MNLQISPSTDLDRLIEPHREAMKIAYAGFFDTPFPTDETLRAEWRSLLAQGATALLAQDAGRPIGVVAVRLIDGEGWLQRFYVHPTVQGQGVGKALHDRALAELTARGCTRANLWVLSVNTAAIGCYRHWGWQQVPCQSQAPFGLPESRFCLDLAVRDQEMRG